MITLSKNWVTKNKNLVSFKFDEFDVNSTLYYVANDISSTSNAKIYEIGQNVPQDKAEQKTKWMRI